MKFVALLLIPLFLSSCSGAAGLSALGGQSGQISGTAASLFGIPAATVSTQIIAEIGQIQQITAQLQLLRAQLNGEPLNLPPIPAAIMR